MRCSAGTAFSPRLSRSLTPAGDRHRFNQFAAFLVHRRGWLRVEGVAGEPSRRFTNGEAILQLPVPQPLLASQVRHQ